MNLYESVDKNLKDESINEYGLDGKGYRGMSAGDFFDRMFEEYVPDSGNSKVVGGEIVRAVCRINYRFYNDGDMIGNGYGNETCNSAARFLMKYCPTTDIKTTIDKMWGVSDNNVYEEYLNQLKDGVQIYLENNQELFDKDNTDDIFNYSEPEDKDWEDEYESDKSYIKESDEKIKLKQLNTTPDDNFRIYYRDEKGNLYCDLLGDLYDCTEQGEPIDKVDSRKFILEDEEVDVEEPVDGEDVDAEEPVDVDTEEPVEDEVKIDTKEEAIDFLKGDENEAIEGYEKVLAKLGDYDLGEEKEKYEKVLNHIIEEEKEHIEELEKLLNGEPIEWLDGEVEIQNDGI